MPHFLGTHHNKVDAKNRVSVPATFRTVLKSLLDEDGPVTLILRPSHQHRCIEGWPPSVMERMARPLDGLDPFGTDHVDIATALFSDAEFVEADKEGRIVLPPGLAAHAALTSSVVFMGLGQIFQIWEPNAATARRDDARTKARSIPLPALAAVSGGQTGRSSS